MKKILFTMMLIGTVFIASDALAGGKDGVKKGNRISQKMAVKKSAGKSSVNAKIKSSQLTPVTIDSHKAKAVVVEPAKQSKTK